MTDTYHHNALALGTMLQEYKLLEILGEGSFGIVYLAKGKYLSDLVAIKEYLPSELATRVDGTTIAPTSSWNEKNFQWGLEKFLEEARLLWQLANPQPHPNIIAVRRFFKLHGTAYLVMEYEKGEPLSHVLENAGRLPENQVWFLVDQILKGLETVHAAGITHRDIKPSNIFIHADGTPVLLDFGAARLALGEKTQSAFNAMSPAYAATEQLMGSDNIGPWTDIYALGATLYRAVTGQLPQPPMERLVKERHHTAADLAGDHYGPMLLMMIDRAFADITLNAAFSEFTNALVAAFCRDDHYGHGLQKRVFRHVVNQFHAVHFGHVDVCKHQIDPVVLQNTQGFFAVLCQKGFVE